MHPSVKNGLIVGGCTLLGMVIIAMATIWSQRSAQIVSTGSFQIAGGSGPTQVNVESPGSSQTINEARVFLPNATIQY